MGGEGYYSSNIIDIREPSHRDMAKTVLWDTRVRTDTVHSVRQRWEITILRYYIILVIYLYYSSYSGPASVTL